MLFMLENNKCCETEQSYQNRFCLKWFMYVSLNNIQHIIKKQINYPDLSYSNFHRLVLVPILPRNVNVLELQKQLTCCWSRSTLIESHPHKSCTKYQKREMRRKGRHSFRTRYRESGVGVDWDKFGFARRAFKPNFITLRCTLAGKSLVSSRR